MRARRDCFSFFTYASIRNFPVLMFARARKYYGKHMCPPNAQQSTFLSTLLFYFHHDDLFKLIIANLIQINYMYIKISISNIIIKNTSYA